MYVLYLYSMQYMYFLLSNVVNTVLDVVLRIQTMTAKLLTMVGQVRNFLWKRGGKNFVYQDYLGLEFYWICQTVHWAFSFFGIFLAVHYCADISLAFSSVSHILGQF